MPRILCDEWRPVPLGFILQWQICARGSVHGCWRHLLPYSMRNEWSPLSIGFILHWRTGTSCSVRDADPWIILRAFKHN